MEKEREMKKGEVKKKLKEKEKGNSCRSGTGPIFIPNMVKSLLSVWF